MDSNNKNRKVGISLAVVVVAIVIAVTAYNELQSAGAPTTTPVVTTTSPDTTTSATDNSTANNPVTPVTPVTPIVSPSSNNISNQTPNPAPSNPVVKTPPVATTKQYACKDGTYTATGSYMSPGGEDQVTVTLTIAKDIVTDVSVTPGAQDRTSQRYQQRFIAGYKQYVVGKNIASLNLGVISGSSLTPIGFNAALTQIKAQAKA